VWDVERPLARIFFLHGIISHGGWYETSCQRLAEAGFEVHFLERRGSGLNTVARGEVDRFQTWISDIADYVEAISQPGVPSVLAGISWGGKLAAAVAKDRQGLLGGLVLICPGIHALRGPGPVRRTLVRLLRHTPARRLRFTVPLQNPALFTDLANWQRFIADDPLVLRKITLQAARENLALDDFVRDAAEQIGIPTLTLLAGRDRIINNAAIRRYHARLRCTKTLIEYPDAVHTFEFGPQPQRHIDDLITWCKSALLTKMNDVGKVEYSQKIG
jgi:alpha-beta hydrolase superfamily lysophospholipase